MVPAESVRFFADTTYVDPMNERFVSQEIFDEVFLMIDEAQNYILIDMFLFNDFQGEAKEETRALSQELVDALVTKKMTTPDIAITVVTDPINTVYEGTASHQLDMLAESGVQIVLTDLTKLRDSNPIYSALWRTLFSWFGNTREGDLLPHPFDAESEKISVRSYLALLNFKANHRKLIVADYAAPEGIKMATLVTSANPHDGSSAHGNVALRVNDQVWQDAIASEEAVGIFSDDVIDPQETPIVDAEGSVVVQLLTEGYIEERLIELIDVTTRTDSIDMAMFYLSDRDVVDALARAAHRGAAVRLLLDPNKDAFGREKGGVPNRPVAAELLRRAPDNLEIRWCDTHGEQCHAKLTIISHGPDSYMMLGSANLTRRNVGDYNLETNILVSAAEDIQAITDARSYFDTLWQNEERKIYSTDYETYKNESYFKRALYLIGERAGLSTF
jgi:phosphatidylserine/phosphatidylglycerophosphate/cardiolipin synthase-like enzyme